jgi:hypothetical protein
VSRGSIALGDVAEHTTVRAVVCSRCERAGRYNLDTLIARHGFGFGVPKLHTRVRFPSPAPVSARPCPIRRRRAA